MSVNSSALTAQQNQLLGDFIRSQEAAKNSLQDMANKYKACVDAGMDMVRYVPESLALRLLAIASGTLVNDIPPAKLMALPDSAIPVLASLPKSDQKDLWANGVDIWRQSGSAHVELVDLSASEFRRLADITGGHGRILTPAEQRDRIAAKATNVPVRDQLVTVRLTHDEMKEAAAKAHKLGKPVHWYIAQLVQNDTGVKPPKHRGVVPQRASRS